MTRRFALAVAVILAVSVVSTASAQNPITTDSPYQVRYLSNLNVADSFVNMTNTGAQSGGPGTVPANLCANTYVFSPDGTMEACCTCRIEPNALRSHSARRDLISNTLTPEVQTSVMVKVLASIPVGGTCNAAAPGALATGIRAWATTNHVVTSTTTVPNTNPVCQQYCGGAFPSLAAWCQQNCGPQVQTTITTAATETPFAPATLSAGELSQLTNLCSFIQANGGGFGICRSCQVGGL